MTAWCAFGASGEWDVSLADFPRLAGEADDSPRFMRALSAASRLRYISPLFSSFSKALPLRPIRASRPWMTTRYFQPSPLRRTNTTSSEENLLKSRIWLRSFMTSLTSMATLWKHSVPYLSVRWLWFTT